MSQSNDIGLIKSLFYFIKVKTKMFAFLLIKMKAL